ncbi:MAG: hypothetical protein J7M14_05030, partial [Planctomycetes bacterium]|nr:hypothetical protein [Planctomycetota bacterium]
LRVDMHKRFSLETFLALVDKLNDLRLGWIEEPAEIGADYSQIRQASEAPIAAGELYFGQDEFRKIAARGWADVIMPDVKHVGGFAALLEACRVAAEFGCEVSPHNPSGAVSTLASIHAAAAAPNVTSLEIALPGEGGVLPAADWISQGMAHLPEGPGWGLRHELDNLW